MKKLLFSMLFIATMLTTMAQRSPLPFKDGDRIVFTGNSITEQGFYEMYIWQYYMLHFPERKIIIKNGGIGGDNAKNILDRLDDDILAGEPSVVVMSFGMNDSRYFEYLNTPQEKVRKEAVAAAYESYEKIENKLMQFPGIQKIIMTSSPYDETMAGTKNLFKGKYTTMEAIAGFQQASAKKNDWSFVDLMRPMTAINLREQKKDTNFTITGPDRIHPGTAGHFTMAWLFLKAQGLANSVVADVRINAKKKKLLKSENSSISNIEASPGKISFQYKANSLPFPIDDQPRVWENSQKQSDALAVIPFTEEFNKEMITISGLKKDATYSLDIDGETLGKWTGDQFGKGINLALIATTPQYKQAQKIASLNLRYHELEGKLRAYYWLQYNYFKKKGLYLQDTQAALDSVNNAPSSDWAVASKRDNYQLARKKEMRDQWINEMNNIISEIYSMNQPVEHKVSISIAE